MTTTKHIADLMALGFTQDQIARETGVTQGTISNHSRKPVKRVDPDFARALRKLLRAARRDAHVEQAA